MNVFMNIRGNNVKTTRAEAVTRLRQGKLSRREALRLFGGLGLAVAGTAVAGGLVGATPATRGAGLNRRFQQAGEAPAQPKLGLQPDGTRVWRVQAGGGDDAMMLMLNDFYPRALTINAGDAIWFPLAGLHTVTFLSGAAAPPLDIPDPEAKAGDAPRVMLNPAAFFPSGGDTYDGTGYLNSGAPLDPSAPPFVVKFTKPGTYDYTCLLHQSVMNGRVTVQERGATLPKEQADYDKESADLIAQQTAQGQALMAKYAQPTSKQSGPATVWELAAGANDGLIEAMMFMPETLTIKPGDTVRWTNYSTVEPHTVTFAGGADAPELVIPEPVGDGPPKLVYNPAVLAPTAGKVWDGTGVANSGALVAGGQPSWELTVATPGEYVYYCAYHGDPQSGMKAKLVVTG